MITNIIVGFIGLWIFVEALHTYQEDKENTDRVRRDLRLLRIFCGLALMVIAVIQRGV